MQIFMQKNQKHFRGCYRQTPAAGGATPSGTVPRLSPDFLTLSIFDAPTLLQNIDIHV